MGWQKDSKLHGNRALMHKVKIDDNVDETTITAFEEMKVHQEANSISFQIPAAFVFSDSTGRRDSHKPPPLSLFISTYPLLRWPTLKQEQSARYWQTSRMLGSVYSLADLFNLRKSERSSESRFSGKASSDSSSSQRDDRTSERHNDWAIDHQGRRKELKYTHNMT